MLHDILFIIMHLNVFRFYPPPGREQDDTDDLATLKGPIATNVDCPGCSVAVVAGDGGPVYYGSGYLPAADYWRMGVIFGVIYIAACLLIGVPWFAGLY